MRLMQERRKEDEDERERQHENQRHHAHNPPGGPQGGEPGNTQLPVLIMCECERVSPL
jgi:hypothetical protein